ncbi:origin recognition complex subunit 5-like [Ornithodoros turicata]|uniref:origin recognition complex subunit 5-like n=1 Tax=Ornithodoros turicata TaxID=34597 RepID=UPI00313937C1
MDAALDNICEDVHCRRKQAKTLLQLMGLPENSGACQSLYVYGCSSTGKTCLVQKILQKLQVKHAYVNVVATYTARMLFETIINQLACHVPSVENDFSNYASCENTQEFLRHLKNVVSEDLDCPSAIYIGIDNSERLRDFDPTVLATFLRLQELTKRHICVILISEILWEKFRCGTGFCEPYFVHFPQYSRDDLVRILCSYRPDGYSEDFYAKFLHLLLSVFYVITCNLRELQYVAQVNFKQFCAPIDDGSASEKDIHRLWRNVEPHMKKSLQSVYLKEVSSSQLERMQSREGEPGTSAPKKSLVELPFYSKFLLLAAYMASYNPPSTDRKFFVKNQGKTPKRRPSRAKQKPNNHILGPKMFPLSRMLAIFYAIVDESVGPSSMIFAQIKTLVSLRLMAQVTADDQLSGPKYKCLVGLDFIREISRTVNFDVTGHLNDFNI